MNRFIKEIQQYISDYEMYVIDEFNDHPNKRRICGVRVIEDYDDKNEILGREFLFIVEPQDKESVDE